MQFLEQLGEERITGPVRLAPHPAQHVLAVFTLASLACGLAANATVLIVSRATRDWARPSPQTLALVGVAYEGRQRVTAVTAGRVGCVRAPHGP